MCINAVCVCDATRKQIDVQHKILFSVKWETCAKCKQHFLFNWKSYFVFIAFNIHCTKFYRCKSIKSILLIALLFSLFIYALDKIRVLVWATENSLYKNKSKIVMSRLNLMRVLLLLTLWHRISDLEFTLESVFKKCWLQTANY